MLPLILVLLVFLAGCVAPINYAALERDRNLTECNQIADAYDFRGAVRRQYMSQCVMVTAGTLASAPSSSFRGTQPAIGQADQFGPLGYRGPTWERVNGQFQGAPTMQPTMIVPIAPHPANRAPIMFIPMQ